MYEPKSNHTKSKMKFRKIFNANCGHIDRIRACVCVRERKRAALVLKIDQNSTAVILPMN